MENSKFSAKHLGIHSVVAICNYKNRIIIYGTSNYLHQIRSDGSRTRQIAYICIKSLFLDGDQLYVATKDNVLVVNAETFRIKDTIWHERPTAIHARHDTVYIGTLNGLYCRYPDGKLQFLGENTPALGTRITALSQDASGILWVGTYSDGLMGYRQGKIVASINQEQGLAGNVCRTLYLNGDHLWVGTDKGLNRINVTRSDHPIIKYTTGDGLIADMVNALYIDSNKIFVGTPEGITFFDEEKIIRQSRCDLRFTDITVGDSMYYPGEAPTAIPHAKNSIRFGFVGISYKSTGDIRYRYRLLGLDSVWHETRETFVSYPALPSGDYELQLQAINKFDVQSKLLSAPFTVEKLLSERSWFRLLIVLSFLAFTGVLVYIFIRRIRKREAGGEKL